MPYIMKAAEEAHSSGIPVMRPMVLAFPDDETAKYLDRQYMFGPSILVAPVMDPEGYCRFYLPEGKWYPLLGGKAEQGGSWKDGRMVSECAISMAMHRILRSAANMNLQLCIMRMGQCRQSLLRSVYE